MSTMSTRVAFMPYTTSDSIHGSVIIRLQVYYHPLKVDKDYQMYSKSERDLAPIFLLQGAVRRLGINRDKAKG